MQIAQMKWHRSCNQGRECWYLVVPAQLELLSLLGDAKLIKLRKASIVNIIKWLKGIRCFSWENKCLPRRLAPNFALLSYRNQPSIAEKEGN